MGAHLRALPDPVRAVLLEFLAQDDLVALHDAGIVDWRLRSAWQQRLPLELAQHILGYLPPASFYNAVCVCANFRCASRSVTLLRTVVRRARELSDKFRKELEERHVVVGRIHDIDRLWTLFLIASPTRNPRRARPYRVSTLNFRPFTAQLEHKSPPRVFMSDYAGVLAVAASTAICLYSVDRLRSAKSGSAADANPHIASLPYPARLSYDRLLDVSIAHQVSESMHLVIIAVFEDPHSRRTGLLFRSDVYYVISQSGDHRRLAFSQVSHTPLQPVWDRQWGRDSAEWLWSLWRKWKKNPRPPPSRDVQLRVIEPPHPCATAVALRSNGTTWLLLFDVLIDCAGGRGLSPYKRYKQSVPAHMPSPAEGAIRQCAVNPTRLLFAMSPGKHRRRRRHTQSSDRSYPPMSEDKDAVVDRESFLEWFSELCWPPYTPVLKSLNDLTHYGVEFCDGRLLVCRSRLTHSGLIFNKTRVELKLPEAVEGRRPSSVAALNTADDDEFDAGRGVILIAACWDDPSELHLYEVHVGQLSSRVAQLVQPRRLARFGPINDPKRRMVESMRFYGGVSRTWRGMPCERAALLVVIMASSGFVHVCHLATGTGSSSGGSNGYNRDWAVNASTKLRLGVNGVPGWRRHWTVQDDGRLTPQ
ncbi:hypothetical protein EXIGLDRAFT_726030 [Exidia glandulosa HHB12029]|uniref:F-box domain-containing protein n=1 Tax=Exidia glandulosa HHB12029 TaxID=1314781 RepID=A0A165DWI9_EXIGL|nr:hypothetical protein EXIGLDRAFT_726030 [Exidia glandulosa HHB12029]